LSLHLAVVVDDVQLQAVGPSATLTARTIARATRMATTLLSVECHMIISEPKMMVLGSSAAVTKEMTLFKQIASKIRKHARNLGTDFTAGRRLGHRVRAERIKNAKVRIPLFRRLLAGGGPNGHPGKDWDRPGDALQRGHDRGDRHDDQGDEGHCTSGNPQKDPR
jgi:hypothetical protein